jgi:signal transduction histidine kinase
VPLKLTTGVLGRLLHWLQSLRVTIALTVVAGVMLASTVTFFEQSNELKQAHEAQIQKELERLGTLTALAMREPLWQFAPEQAASIIEAAFINPDVVSIVVWDHKGVPFADRNRIAPDSNQVAEASHVVQRDGALVGKLRIRMSTAGYLATLEELRWQYFTNAAQSAAMALLVILLLLQWRLVRPLNHLVRASTRIELGELETPIRRAFNDEVGALATSLDATRQSLIGLIAQLESRNQALVESNLHLERRVAERTASLETALSTLERAQNEIIQTEKLASLGRVVAGVAHELNTPIGNALTVATALENDVQEFQTDYRAGVLRKSVLENLLERLNDGLGLAARNLQRSATLIADFKQVAVDNASDQRRTFDLGEVSQEILNMLQPALRKAGCEVVRELPPDLYCDGYPGRFGQVLTNLVMNALTHAFVPETSGVLRVSVARVDDHTVALTVADNGVGMDEHVRAHIFDPFFTTKMGRGGTGLGMNIVHGIVLRVLGGSIQIDSTPGRGTAVTVTMPRVAPHGDDKN